MSTRPQDPETSHERVEHDVEERQGEGTFAKAAGVGTGMFLPAVIVLLVGLAVILYLVLR